VAAALCACSSFPLLRAPLAAIEAATAEAALSPRAAASIATRVIVAALPPGLPSFSRWAFDVWEVREEGTGCDLTSGCTQRHSLHACSLRLVHAFVLPLCCRFLRRCPSWPSVPSSSPCAHGSGSWILYPSCPSHSCASSRSAATATGARTPSTTSTTVSTSRRRCSCSCDRQGQTARPCCRGA
jgi:hypothetical protein